MFNRRYTNVKPCFWYSIQIKTSSKYESHHTFSGFLVRHQQFDAAYNLLHKSSLVKSFLSQEVVQELRPYDLLFEWLKRVYYGSKSPF